MRIFCIIAFMMGAIAFGQVSKRSVSSVQIDPQEIPQLDTLTLMNGLKIYLLQYGEDSVINVRLVINGGKKNESPCEVGFSEIIQQVLNATLEEKQNSCIKTGDKLKCEVSRGQTILSGNCSSNYLNKEIELLSSAILNLSFKKDKMDRVVSSIIDCYKPEYITSCSLSEIYRNMLVYGTKISLGRNYCQYQLQKVLPVELREFYFKYYTAKRSSILICGNFNVNDAKKLISKHFARWKSVHKEADSKRDDDPKILHIKKRAIAFISKRESENYLLKWVQAAPSSKSPDHAAFLMTCDLFDHYLAGKIKEKERLNGDTLTFTKISYSTGFMEINGIAGENEMTNAIKLFDTTLSHFSNLQFTEKDLMETAKNLKSNYLKNNSPETILTFYDPLLYNVDVRKIVFNNISVITVQDIQMILKKYFAPHSYKLIIVGKESAASDQLDALGNVSKYQTSDFQTCDESCVAQNKKKWKKGRKQCCWKCFWRGWCPCMYSPDRLS